MKKAAHKAAFFIPEIHRIVSFSTYLASIRRVFHQFRFDTAQGQA